MQIKLSELNILSLPTACSAFAIKIRSPVAGLTNAHAEQLLQHHLPHTRIDCWLPLSWTWVDLGCAAEINPRMGLNHGWAEKFCMNFRAIRWNSRLCSDSLGQKTIPCKRQSQAWKYVTYLVGAGIPNKCIVGLQKNLCFVNSKCLC